MRCPSVVPIALATLVLAACGVSDTDPISPSNQQAAGRDGGQHHKGFSREFVLLPPCDTTPVDTIPVDTMPVDTVPVDTMPVDSVPTDTMPIDTMPVDTSGPPTLRVKVAGGGNDGGGGWGGGGGGGWHGGYHHRDKGHKHHEESCKERRHHLWESWSWFSKRWNVRGPVGVLKLHQSEDHDSVFADLFVKHLTGNTAYLLQASLDTLGNPGCTSTVFTSLGADTLPLSLVTDSAGKGSQTFFRDVSSFDSTTTYLIRFQVVDSATNAVALESQCRKVTIGH
jgi:hypothetical protein